MKICKVDSGVLPLLFTVSSHFHFHLSGFYYLQSISSPCFLYLMSLHSVYFAPHFFFSIYSSSLPVVLLSLRFSFLSHFHFSSHFSRCFLLLYFEHFTLFFFLYLRFIFTQCSLFTIFILVRFSFYFLSVFLCFLPLHF